MSFSDPKESGVDSVLAEAAMRVEFGTSQTTTASLPSTPHKQPRASGSSVPGTPSRRPALMSKKNRNEVYVQSTVYCQHLTVTSWCTEHTISFARPWEISRSVCKKDICSRRTYGRTRCGGSLSSLNGRTSLAQMVRGLFIGRYAPD